MSSSKLLIDLGIRYKKVKVKDMLDWVMNSPYDPINEAIETMKILSSIKCFIYDNGEHAVYVYPNGNCYLYKIPLDNPVYKYYKYTTHFTDRKELSDESIKCNNEGSTCNY